MEKASNNKIKKILYLTYDGITDPVGQSQILPYIAGNAKDNLFFYVISFEKKDNFRKNFDRTKELIKGKNIKWIKLSYHKNPPVISTLYDLYTMWLISIYLIIKNKIHIIHCRSYVTSLIGLWCKRWLKTKFIFDMRGFWADERIERNIWNKNNPIYCFIYNYFKKLEKRFLSRADFIITLTNSSKNYLLKHFSINKSSIVTIPCSTIFKNSNEINFSKSKNKPTLIYVGSFRTAYLEDEMFLFFSIFKKKFPDSIFIILTSEKQDYFTSYIRKYNLDINSIIIRNVKYEEVFEYLQKADLGICFIKPSFSSIASSPIKFAEMLSAGLPVICNNIGDLKQHCKEIPFTYCCEKLDKEEFENFIKNFALPSPEEKAIIRKEAKKIYDIKLAISKYSMIYNTII